MKHSNLVSNKVIMRVKFPPPTDSEGEVLTKR